MELIGSFAIGCSARKAAEVGIQGMRKLSTSLRELQTSDSISPELFNEIAQLGHFAGGLAIIWGSIVLFG